MRFKNKEDQDVDGGNVFGQMLRRKELRYRGKILEIG
jgi:hypothetical protein